MNDRQETQSILGKVHNEASFLTIFFHTRLENRYLLDSCMDSIVAETTVRPDNAIRAKMPL